MNTLRLITMMLLTIIVQGALADDIIRVCGQNVQNFFYSLDRTRTTDNSIAISNYNTEEGRTAKLNAIISALAPYSADIYAFNEVECCEEVMELLAQRMSTVTGKDYVAVHDGLTYDKASEPGGILKAGFIYNTTRVKPYGPNTATCTGLIYSRFMRMQAFESLSSGERFTLSMNHFKAGSVEENGEARVGNANSLVGSLGNALDPDIIIMGDLNSEMGEECLDIIMNAGFTEQLLRFNHGGYTYCWGGGEIIDHVFANSTMEEQVSDARILSIANPCSTSTPYSDHNPYIVTLKLKDMGQNSTVYVRAQTVTPGKQYVFVGSPFGDGLEAAIPVPANYDYGYWMTQEVAEVDGVLEYVQPSMLFDFEDAGDGKFLIKDSSGRYVFQDKRNNGSYYNSFNMSDDPGVANSFTATLQSDGTFMVVNTQSNDFIQCAVYNNAGEFGLWNKTQTGRSLPYLYEQQTSTGITSPNTHHPSSVVYNLAGQRVLTPTHGIYIVNGKKVFFK